MAHKKSKADLPSETHQSIEEQTAAFLKSGGKITQVPHGVSGIESLTGRKHIVLGNNKKQE